MKIKTFTNISSAFLIIGCFLIIETALGEYKIDSFTINGGGGVSNGEQYIVMGSIGQQDSGYSQNQQYELLGGFLRGEPGCVVDFDDFVIFAEYWMESGDDLPGDLYKDTKDTVDLLDLNLFIDQWLYYCPYDWPLK